ncbi:MAG: glycosyltransferase [Vampirovibrionales bacterium]|nr:glycosyltransferase [Vampirovibrionales bacterium]
MAFYTKKRQPRIFMGLSEVAGYYRHLKAGFDALGVPNTFFEPVPHKFAYHKPSALQQWVAPIILRSDAIKKKKSVERSYLRLLLTALQWLVFAYMALTHDVFIYGYRTTFDGAFVGKRRYRDIALLKAWGKTVIYVFHGSDARPPYLNGNYQDDTPETLAIRTQDRVASITAIERTADVVVNHPPTSLLHKKPVVQWSAVGIPFSGEESVSTQSPAAGDPVRILHAPSIQKTKGTPAVRAAIETLKTEGHAIDFVELVNVPNHQVISYLQKTDILVDELYSDTFLAGLATEAAYYGVPTVVCGLEHDLMAATMTPSFIPPAMTGPPDALVDNLHALISDAPRRKALGLSAQQYVRQQWAPAAVAQRFLRLCRNDIPAEWWYDPNTDTPYVGGWGLAAPDRHSVLTNHMHYAQQLAAQGGPSVLTTLGVNAPIFAALQASLQTNASPSLVQEPLPVA